MDLRLGELSSFFCYRNKCGEKHPEIIERMHEEGHLIGNHTFYHTQLNKEELGKVQGGTDTHQRGNQRDYRRGRNLCPALLTGAGIRASKRSLICSPGTVDDDPLDGCATDVSCITSNVMKKAEQNTEEGYSFGMVEEIVFD